VRRWPSQIICFLLLLWTPSSNSATRLSGTTRLTFSHDGGFVEKPLKLALRPEPALGRTIRYTTDGSAPTPSNGVTFANSIAVSNTVVIRAAAFKERARISPIETHTFLFLEDIIHQTNAPAGYPVGPTGWNGFPADYAMSRAVVDDPVYRDRIKQALRALPTLSIAVGRAELFGKESGLYIHSQERGGPWERPSSVEMFLPDGSLAFQANCGLRIQGNSNRIPEKTPKRSFRLFFREQYGPAKLHYRVFPDSPIERFNTLVLRADFNNSWTHWNPVAQVRGQRIRDAWLKDSQRAMGGLSSHTRFAHLYLNGLYWGIYDITERPDATFAAAYLGGNKEDYDVVNELQSKDGDLTGYSALMNMSGLTNATQYQKLQRMLDVTGYVDYLLLNYYAGNHDWSETKNWYAIGSRKDPQRFRYFCWDGEFIMQDLSDDVVGSGMQPFRLIAELRANAEFRVLIADRIQKHFFGAGALTPSAASERWMKRARELDVAIVAESARWGAHRRNPPYTRDHDWIAEQQRLQTNWFPQRTGVVMQQLRGAGLYPPIDAPRINCGNSSSAATIDLSMIGPANCTIYFSTNGSDPRAPIKGTVDAGTLTYSNTVRLVRPLTIKARAKQGDVWSALTQAQY